MAKSFGTMSNMSTVGTPSPALKPAEEDALAITTVTPEVGTRRKLGGITGSLGKTTGTKKKRIKTARTIAIEKGATKNYDFVQAILTRTNIKDNQDLDGLKKLLDLYDGKKASFDALLSTEKDLAIEKVEREFQEVMAEVKEDRAKVQQVLA